MRYVSYSFQPLGERCAQGYMYDVSVTKPSSKLKNFLCLGPVSVEKRCTCRLIYTLELSDSLNANHKITYSPGEVSSQIRHGCQLEFSPMYM